MIKKFIMFVIVLVSLTGVAFAYDDILNVKFVKNYDGDTFTVNITTYPEIIGSKITVRVLGIDAPEIKGKCEKEQAAAKFVKEAVYKELKNAQVIHLLNPKRDKYFRILADVMYDGKSLKDFLLSLQEVYKYDGGTKLNPWCK